jgi:hypothetical protein
MREKRFFLSAVVISCLLGAVALSSPGRSAIRRVFSTTKTAQPSPSVSDSVGVASADQTGPDLESRARVRHGWNAGVLNSVMRGTITFYERDGTSAGQGNLTVYRAYPNRMRVELDRGATTEVWGFDQVRAWRSGELALGEGRARDLRQWLRLCPERLFTTRGGGASYREAGMRKEDLKPGRPWQEQMRINPPLELEQVEMEDIIGALGRAGDRRLVTYYINSQDFTIESARWLEPDDPQRNIDDPQSAKIDVRIDFDDWQRMGGVLWPFDIVHWMGGKVDYRIVVNQAGAGEPAAR